MHRLDASCSGLRPESPGLGLLSHPPSWGKSPLPQECDFQIKPTNSESHPVLPLLLGSHTPGHYTPAPATPVPGAKQLGVIAPESTEIVHTSHAFPQFSLLPLPVTDPGASPWGLPVTCCGTLLGISEYHKLSFQWQSSLDLLALPYLNNHF